MPTPLKNMSSPIGMMTFRTEWKSKSDVPVTTNQLHKSENQQKDPEMGKTFSVETRKLPTPDLPSLKRQQKPYCLVVSTPLNNLKVSWDDELPKIWEHNPVMFQSPPTSKNVDINVSIITRINHPFSWEWFIYTNYRTGDDM